MKPLKLIHLSDVHFSRETQEKALASLKTVCATAEREEVDLVVIAGDLFDRPVTNTESAGFPALLDVMQRIMNIAPVVAVRGTPAHDASGCYAPFAMMNAVFPFDLLTPNITYWLDDLKHKAMVFGIPEVGKEYFLRDKQLGKEEANEEIKRGMRELLLGLGAKRKQYPDIPCILVSHCVVVGASISESQVLPAGGIQIGRDDLALVGADYIALGHVHLAQDIPGIPAYYAGSAFPVDWGEMDQKGCNLVEIERTVSSTERKYVRIPYPHPPRRKIVFHPGDELEEYDPDFDTWIVARGTKQELEKYDGVLKTIEYDLPPGSRLTKEVIPTETVRAGEIQDAIKLRDKVQIYADNSGEKVSAAILEKADSLEIEARAEGAVTEGLHVRILKLTLRGAIGILKGTGRDQIEIDLDQYDPGLIALVGINGSGKTTALENLHPYPQMLTRSGKLQDHFYLRDSFRDLTFTDERTGNEYRAFIQIDGANKSGGAEYFLYKNGQPITNGRKDDYEEKILKLFGSLPLYLRSAFVSQRQPKNLPDLSDATKGEKKALFRELGGLDYLQTYSDSAKAKAQAIGEELIGIRAKVERENDLKFSLEEATRLKEKETAEYDISKIALNATKARGFMLKEKSDRLSVIVQENRALRTRMEEIRKLIAENDRELGDVAVKVQRYQLILQAKDATEKGIAEYETLKEQEAKLHEERARINEERTRLINQWHNETTAVGDVNQSLQDERRKHEGKLSAFEKQETISIQAVSDLDRELDAPISDICPTCKQPWPPGERERFETDHRKKADRLKVLEAEIFGFGKSIAGKKKEIAGIEAKIKALVYPPRPELPPFDEKVLSSLQVQILRLDITALRDNQKRLAEAAVYIEEGKRRMMTLDSQRIEKEAEYEDCLKRIDKAAEVEYEIVQRDLETARQEYIRCETELAKITATIEHLQREKIRLEGELAEIEKLKASAAEKGQHQREWEYLQRACGPDGIQALELDAMGPGIEQFANDFLEYAKRNKNNHFDQICFKTQRIGGEGKNARQIEDFLIFCHDVRDGKWTDLAQISIGESVWVKRALYDAFGLVRTKNTNTKFLTVFQDEADGAIDPEARSIYVQMLEKAHQEAKRYHTILITHSSEVQEMIGQKIEMEKFAEAVAVQ